MMQDGFIMGPFCDSELPLRAACVCDTDHYQDVRLTVFAPILFYGPPVMVYGVVDFDPDNSLKGKYKSDD